MKYKAIIFDMDGTIINTSPIWSQVNKDLIESKGIVFSQELESELKKRIHGLALDRACHVIKELCGLPDSLEDLIKEKVVMASMLYKEGIEFIEGFETFHSHVKKHNLKTGVATNADDYTFAIARESLPLEFFFGEHIYNIAHVGYVPKPDPAIYLYTAQKLELKPSECIVIEDSAHGIEAAKNAGMYCIGINTSKSYEQVKHSDHVVEGYAEINLLKLLR